MIDFNWGIALGPVKEEYLPKMLEWRNDSRIRQWCRQYDIIQPWAHKKWYESLANRDDVRMYAIINTHGKVVGICGLTNIDQLNQRAEFSLYIGPEYQRHGYGFKALSTLIDHGFRNLNLHTIWGESYDKNPACGLFEAVGMGKEGTRRNFYFRDGAFLDAHLYSVVRSEWKQ